MRHAKYTQKNLAITHGYDSDADDAKDTLIDHLINVSDEQATLNNRTLLSLGRRNGQNKQLDFLFSEKVSFSHGKYSDEYLTSPTDPEDGEQRTPEDLAKYARVLPKRSKFFAELEQRNFTEAFKYFDKDTKSFLYEDMAKIFFHACRNNDLEMLEAICNFDIEAIVKNQRPFVDHYNAITRMGLMDAFRYGNIEAAEFLISFAIYEPDKASFYSKYFDMKHYLHQATPIDLILRLGIRDLTYNPDQIVPFGLAHIAEIKHRALNAKDISNENVTELENNAAVKIQAAGRAFTARESAKVTLAKAQKNLPEKYCKEIPRNPFKKTNTKETWLNIDVGIIHKEKFHRTKRIIQLLMQAVGDYDIRTSRIGHINEKSPLFDYTIPENNLKLLMVAYLDNILDSQKFIKEYKDKFPGIIVPENKISMDDLRIQPDEYFFQKWEQYSKIPELCTASYKGNYMAGSILLMLSAMYDLDLNKQVTSPYGTFRTDCFLHYYLIEDPHKQIRRKEGMFPKFDDVCNMIFHEITHFTHPKPNYPFEFILSKFKSQLNEDDLESLELMIDDHEGLLLQEEKATLIANIVSKYVSEQDIDFLERLVMEWKMLAYGTIYSNTTKDRYKLIESVLEEPRQPYLEHLKYYNQINFRTEPISYCLISSEDSIRGFFEILAEAQNIDPLLLALKTHVSKDENLTNFIFDSCISNAGSKEKISFDIAHNNIAEIFALYDEQTGNIKLIIPKGENKSEFKPELNITLTKDQISHLRDHQTTAINLQTAKQLEQYIDPDGMGGICTIS